MKLTQFLADNPHLDCEMEEDAPEGIPTDLIVLVRRVDADGVDLADSVQINNSSMCTLIIQTGMVHQVAIQMDAECKEWYSEDE